MTMAPHEQPPMIGDSPAMREVRETIEIAAASGLAVLVTGETGVGKELVAHALHRASGRPGSFVAVNACASSESMFEDHMFGHVRGAFTGAISDRPGYFVEANGGTLFLDEISGLSRDAQAKLLRAVETRTVRPVGARRDVASDFRLITASNEDLDHLVSQERFRADLVYRLRGIEIRVPPLRERLEDVPALANHFVSNASAHGARLCGVSPNASRLLQRFDWPGNVRQLYQVVSRAAAFARDSVILQADHLQRVWCVSSTSERRGTTAPPVREDLERSLSRRLLLECLQRHGWDTVAVAAELQVSRKTVYARIHRYGIPLHGIHGWRGESRVNRGESPEVPREPRMLSH